MNRFFSLTVLGALTICSNGKIRAQENMEIAEKKRPNILFILSDDHTSQAWGIYGGILADYVQNPNIRRFFSEIGRAHV